jgi:hypothetical protein
MRIRTIPTSRANIAEDSTCGSCQPVRERVDMNRSENSNGQIVFPGIGRSVKASSFQVSPLPGQGEFLEIDLLFRSCFLSCIQRGVVIGLVGDVADVLDVFDLAVLSNNEDGARANSS